MEYKNVFLKRVEVAKSSRGSYRKLFENDKIYTNCFKDDLYDKIDSLEGKNVKLGLEQKGNYKNVVGIWPADDNSVSQDDQSYSHSSNKPDWSQKDFAITQQSQMERAVELIGPLYLEMFKAEQPKDTAFVQFMDNMVQDVLTVQTMLFDKVWGAITANKGKEVKAGSSSSPHGTDKIEAETPSNTEDDDIPF